MSESRPRPPFDPELDAAYAVFSEQIPLVMTIEMAVAGREPGVYVDVSEQLLAEAGVTRREITVPGYEGAELVASVFARADHTGEGPGIYHVHGGGMISGERTIGIPQALPWMVEHDAVAVTVEYRLAPEFPDPYPVEDCYAGLAWTAEHAAELGIDPRRLLIAGASAGGGLAAGTALLARDRRGPELIGQVLLCPMLDDRNATTSAEQYDDRGSWVRESNLLGWTALLGERRGTEDVSIYAAPARDRPLRTPAGLHRVRFRRGVPGRGRRLRHDALGLGRTGRAAGLGGRLPRLRHDRAARRRVPGGRGRPGQLGRQADRHLTGEAARQRAASPRRGGDRREGRRPRRGLPTGGLLRRVPGLAEYSIFDASLLHIVPDGLDLRMAALVEPMSVRWHAVARTGIQPGGTALVAGVRPIGLGAWFVFKTAPAPRSPRRCRASPRADARSSARRTSTPRSSS